MPWHKCQIFDPSGFINTTAPTYNIYFDVDTNLYLWYEDSKWRIASTLGRILQDVNATGGAVTTWYSQFWVVGRQRMFSNNAILTSSSQFIWNDWIDSYSGTYFITYALYGWSTGTGRWSNSSGIGGNLINTYGPTSPATGSRTTSWKTFDGWTSATLAGTYTAEGTATGTKYVGSLAYVDTAHNFYRGQIGVSI
jgi:hypothetical protein